jgi:hypothetical protein
MLHINSDKFHEILDWRHNDTGHGAQSSRSSTRRT